MAFWASSPILRDQTQSKTNTNIEAFEKLLYNKQEYITIQKLGENLMSKKHTSITTGRSFLIVLILLIFAVFSFYWRPKTAQKYPSKVKIPSYETFSLEGLDPTDVVDSQQFNLLRSIYSTLVYFDTNGRIRTGAAEKFEVSNNTIRFYIRKNFRTSTGDLITAKDVYLSFKRLLLLNKNTHGKLTDFINCDLVQKSMTSECDGIRFEGDIFEIDLKEAKFIPYFLPILANPDFSILPEKAVDYAGNLKILNYNNTSGPYYLDSFNKDKTIFRVNKEHYLIDERNPETIELVPEGDSRIDRFKNGEFDVILTYQALYLRDIELLGDLSNYNVHKTMPIKLFKVNFTPNGRNKLSREERLSIGAQLRKAFYTSFPGHRDFKPTDDYFSVVGEGALLPDQQQKVTEAFKVFEKTLLNREVTADISVTWAEKAKSIVEKIPNCKFVELFRKKGILIEPSPDAFVIDTDAGGFDNISLLSYMQSFGGLGMTETEFSKWLSDYVDTTDTTARLKKFRDLHFSILYNAHVVPIGVEPYYGIARKPWKIEAYQMFAGSPFWTIKREQ